MQKEITYTPRLLFVDLKGSSGGLPQWSSLYEDISTFNVNENEALWPSDKIEIERESEYEKNEFLDDLEKETIEMKVDNRKCLES